MVGRLILEKQTRLLNLQQRFEVEQELVYLETTLEAQVCPHLQDSVIRGRVIRGRVTIAGSRGSK